VVRRSITVPRSACPPRPRWGAGVVVSIASLIAAAPASAQWTEEVTLENAAFDTPRAPSAVVHAGPRFDRTRPLRLVVFIHGWRGCARALAGSGEVRCGRRAVDGWGLADRFDEGRSDALFVVPQLAFMTRDGSAGRFAEPGRFAAFLDELLGALEARLGEGASLARVESIALMAHSAGYETTLAILDRGGVDRLVRAVVLFDALYRGHPRFARWVLADPTRRLVSLHAARGRTASQSRLLAVALRERLGGALSVDEEGAVADLLRAHRVVIAPAGAPHGDVPAQHLPELLRVLLPARAQP